MKTGARGAEGAAPGNIVVIKERCSLFSVEFDAGWKMNGEPGGICLVLGEPNLKTMTLKIMHPQAGTCYAAIYMLSLIDG